VHPAPKVRKVRLGRKEMTAMRVLLARLAQRDQQAIPVQRVTPDRRAFLGLRARRVQRAIPETPVPLALTELLALRAVKAHRVPKDRRVK
jgi:hypothetical protein